MAMLSHEISLRGRPSDLNHQFAISGNMKVNKNDILFAIVEAFQLVVNKNTESDSFRLSDPRFTELETPFEASPWGTFLSSHGNVLLMMPGLFLWFVCVM